MAGSNDKLKRQLLLFDGRSMTVLGEAHAKWSKCEGYPDDLVSLCGDAEGSVSAGATWLLKKHLEEGGALSGTQTLALADQLTAIGDWSAQLHICQSVQYLSFDAEGAKVVAAWLEPLLAHRRPFVRAWSLDALCRLAACHGAFKSMASSALYSAHEDTAASVRARARNLAKISH